MIGERDRDRERQRCVENLTEEETRRTHDMTGLLHHLSTAKRKFAESLNEFKFQCIGDAETDDEICIAKSLQEFAGVLQNLEDERTRMVSLGQAGGGGAPVQ
uniref:BAR domain-containing protein n=1 Tax=Hucho hucho TaxID=62062 RepID=A0A4W5JQL0_9TELE